MLDRQQGGRANAEVDPEQQEESAVWEIAGKLATLGQAVFDADDEEVMLEQIRELQHEAAEALG